MPATAIHAAVERARAGAHDACIGRVSSGWVVMGETQVLRGYSLLLPDPVVPDLQALSADQRRTFLYEMSCVGDAVLAVTGAARINYGMLGNAEPALHAHVFPRYADEPDDLRRRPVWFYDWSAAPKFDAARDGPLRDSIREELRRMSLIV